MAKKLTMLKINTLGSVDTPANQYGKALLFKRADVTIPPTEPKVDSTGIIGKLKKFASELIAYAKDDGGAEDLNSILNEMELNELLWDMNYALTDSISSILEDDTVSDKKSAVIVSLQQYLDNLAAEGAFDNPSAVMQVGKKFTDQIRTLIESGAIAKGDTICPTCGTKMVGGTCPDCGYTAPVAKAQKSATKEGEEPMKLEDLMKNANLSPEVKAFLQAQEDTKATLEKSLKDTQTAVDFEKAARLDREYLSKAQGLSGLAQKPEDFGPILKGIAEKAPEEYVKLEPLLKGWNEVMNQSAIFKEVGKGGSNLLGSAATTEEEINKRASELMKSDTSLTMAKAITKALESDPVLYDQYQAELDANE